MTRIYRVRYNVCEVIKMDKKYDALLLENQLCFPLYAVSNMIIRKYKPLLDELDLTYTQYIVMMVLWEKEEVNEKVLCDSLCLKSNTITPLLNKLKDKGNIKKEKALDDERNLVISLTESGINICIPPEFILKGKFIFYEKIIVSFCGYIAFVHSQLLFRQSDKNSP